MLRIFCALVTGAAGLYAADLALVGARIYPGPEASPIARGTVVIRGGRILSVEPGISKPAAGTKRVDCAGLVVMAGFWNCHVHFSEPKWENAGSIPREQMAEYLREMFLRWGFTSVFDTGSFLGNTQAIARRVEAGEIRGPMIRSTGEPFTSKDATPYYLHPLKLPELETTEQAVRMAGARLDAGADAIKIFQGAWVAPGKVVPMRLDLVKAVAEVAHSRRKLLLAHPSNAAGLQSAIEGGVDVLTHLVEAPGDLDAMVVAQIKTRRMAVIPTLMLFGHNDNLDQLIDQLSQLSDAGVQILFGTDVGFLTDYDPLPEFRLLDRAGLNFPQILACLTTNPCLRYGFSQGKGRVEPGMDADLVVLGGDPAEEVSAWTDVRYTIRKGEIAYSKSK